MKQKIKQALIVSSILFILAAYPIVRNLYSISLNREIKNHYLPVQAQILKRVDLAFNDLYYKMRLYVRYTDQAGDAYEAWIQMPVSNDRYPEKYTTVYYSSENPGKIVYPESSGSIITGYVFSAIFFTIGIIVIGYYIKKPL